MIDRNEAPPLHMPDSIRVAQARPERLGNGMDLFVVDAGTEDVIKLELVFPTGTSDRNGLMLAAACHHLFDSGTGSKSAMDIAESFDYYGSHFQTDFGPDWKSLSLFSLNRFFRESLELLREVFDGVLFPESEIATWKTRSLQSLAVNREKVSWLSKTSFLETLFGESHPYGFTATDSDYEVVSSTSLRTFFKTGYPVNECLVVLSGRVNTDAVDAVQRFFGTTPAGMSKVRMAFPEPFNGAPVKKKVAKKEALQCGIRIGKLLFGKTHPDYPAMQVVNTIFGGYFGSRLMSNIREEKGYTYGIGSGLNPYRHGGIFTISTEVGTDVCAAAIAEIYIELQKMAIVPVPAAELDLVRNYLLGTFQRSIDGPFALADRFKGLRLWNLDYTYLENYLDTVRKCTPEQIMELADKYLRPESMTEVVAG